MQPTKTLRLLLLISALAAMGIGASLLFAPAQFHASYGIELGRDPSLLSEVRAPGAALLALGALMLLGVFVRTFTQTATIIAAVVYLAYGLARLVSFGLDGMPDDGLIEAAAIELVIGSLCVAALVRSRRAAALEVA